jgi:hypothetical protein
MPLALTTEENGAVSVGRADRSLRPQFLQEVAAELEANRQAGEIGEGSVHRAARTVQRRFFDPPQLASVGESKLPAPFEHDAPFEQNAPFEPSASLFA